jgi:LysM repeat protein
VDKKPTFKKIIPSFLGLLLAGYVLIGPGVRADELAIPSDSAEKPTEKMKGTPYTVQRGDTLWGISSHFLSDPFYWPKLWKENKFILNPDLIYPGNVIIFPTEEQLREALERTEETASPAAEEKVSEEAVSPAAPAQPPTAREETPLPPLVLQPELPSNNRDLVFSSGYIIREPEPSGRVIASTEEKVMYSRYDTVYLLPSARPKVGDRLTAYRVVRKVYHPKTDEYLGNLIRILGTMEVTAVEDKTATAVVSRSYDVIMQGDPYLPYKSLEQTDVDRDENGAASRLDGYIVDVKEEKLSNAQFDVVFIDKGHRDGLLVGRSFLIFREGSKTPVTAPVSGIQLPRRKVGELQVISVQDETSIAKVVRSTEPIIRGDVVESPASP